MLKSAFFNRDAVMVAKDLLGKVIRVQYQQTWLSAQIIETEAYYLTDKGSHASLGYTEKRKALFMSAGTIYMYYARGGDSLNISCQGEGNAVLIKSAYPFFDRRSPRENLSIMQKLNPPKNHAGVRSVDKLCNGQTLLCRSLGLKVPDWDAKQFDDKQFYFEDIGYRPEAIIQSTRLGIPKGRDEHLPYRFIDSQFIKFCTKKPPYVAC